ncbi:Glutamyl-tRNA(Gln) amidotransferase subunit B [Cercospora zeina]
MNGTLPSHFGVAVTTSIASEGVTALEDYQFQLRLIEMNNNFRLQGSNLDAGGANPNNPFQLRPGPLPPLTAAPVRRVYHTPPPLGSPVTPQCTACCEPVEPRRSLRLSCLCYYCSSCITHLFTRALTDETLYPPSCHGDPIDFAKARPHLPYPLLRTYRLKSVELSTKNKVYCSNTGKCNEFIAPHSIHNGKAFCQKCAQVTCVKCKEKEHWGPCEESEGVLGVMRMAGEMKWQACPECKRVVEKANGCNHILCRCGTDFCYACGSIYGGCDCDANEEDEDDVMNEEILYHRRAVMPTRPQRRELEEDMIEDTMVAPFGWGEDEFADRALRAPRACFVAKWLQSRRKLSTSPLAANQHETNAVPLRKHLKDEAKRKKADAKLSNSIKPNSDPRLDKWELTVGIEIHAELNTKCKLFSSAPALSGEENGGPANSKVALFDAALPGTQPQFQVATLLPALRAAIALGCDVQRKSGWDRKHYFHWDQPNGYQITQYYEPFARNGQLVVTAEDGVPLPDLNGAESLEIGIKQIQMEQDTAKTTSHGASTYHIDLNRAGHPLIEIITLPHIHSPQTAAAVVRKIQSILKSVDACTTGMELGGLRADVNVSIRERGTSGTSSYSGVSGLGQRTEIKNLSSFKAVEDAIIAERGRQISVLEAGGVIEGETRGWTLGATETTRLRGKEGEVDYRYMPDADLPPVLVGEDLVNHLRNTLPELPDDTVERVVNSYGLSLKDAKTVVALDDGDRLEFMEETVALLKQRLAGTEHGTQHKLGKAVGNWVLHELGGLLDAPITWDEVSVTPQELADIISNQLQKQITTRAAKQLLSTLYGTPASGTRRSVEQLIEDGNLRLRPLAEDEYSALMQSLMDENPDKVIAVRDKGQKGKIMWFVGQMVRKGEEGTVEPEMARQVAERMLGG